MIDRLRSYELTLSVSLNPLNWRFGWERYNDWAVCAQAGPLVVLVLK